jgi:periplasmic copper chaperone A
MSKAGILVAAIALAATPASAHITLETKQATIGSSYKAVFAVPHGCAGSATIKIRVQIPEGVIAVKPMPKAGWNVEAISGKYAGEYDYHGSKLSEGVKEVVWSGGKLLDQNYDEFVVSTFLTDGLKPNGTLYFPVVQECEQGISRWIDIPAEGEAGHGGKSPAPGVKLMPKPYYDASGRGASGTVGGALPRGRGLRPCGADRD